MPKFLCERLVRHGDGKGKIRDFEAGASIDLDDESAKPLLAAGAIRAVEEKIKDEKEKGKKGKDEE